MLTAAEFIAFLTKFLFPIFCTNDEMLLHYKDKWNIHSTLQLMQLTPLSYLHANREYILLKLINKEWVGFTYINLYFEYSFRNIKTLYIKIGYSEWPRYSWLLIWWILILKDVITFSIFINEYLKKIVYFFALV